MYLLLSFTESQGKVTKLHSQVEVLKIDEEKQKLQNEQTLKNAQKNLSSTVVNLEVRQTELIEKLKVSSGGIICFFLSI